MTLEYAKLLLNKVIEENAVDALTRHQITLDDMPSEVDRATYKFVTDYAAQNGGQAPSYLTVAAEVPGYEYLPEVSDRYDYLARQIKDYTAQRMVMRWFETGEFERKLNELGGEKFINDYLLPAAEKVKLRTSVREKVGTDIKTDGDKFLAEYERRKAGESFRVWRSKFSAIGEYISGNLYTVFGKSGRGKSVVAKEDGLYAAQQGANVLIWAMEMGWYEVMVRIYVSLSEADAVTNAQYNGVNFDAGFDSRDLRLGQLAEDFEAALRTFLGTLNDKLAGNITIRAVDDADFTDRSLRALESDIKATNADYVIIDPFYYLHYEPNISRTTGGDATNTSQKLRALAGRTQTVIIAITQAEETTEEKDDDGERELALPERKDVKKTKGLLEDASLLIGVDSAYKQGRGLVGVFKGRDGGEGNTSEILYLPQFGVVREMETGEAIAAGFDF